MFFSEIFRLLFFNFFLFTDCSLSLHNTYNPVYTVLHSTADPADTSEYFVP